MDKKRRTRRSSILKKAPPVLTDDTNVDQIDCASENRSSPNPSKKLSKRVSFSNTNQIKEIAPVWDIHKNWQDSASSEESSSALADISNLTTPNVRKTAQDKNDKGPKSLKKLLDGAIICKSNDNSQTVPSTKPNVAAAMTSSGFSFFDNSKLMLGNNSEDESVFEAVENNNDDQGLSSKSVLNSLKFKDSVKINNNLGDEKLGNNEKTHSDDHGQDSNSKAGQLANAAQTMYTKDFLSTFNFAGEGSKKTNADNIKYPSVNPPPYKQCLKEGLGHVVIPVNSNHQKESSENEDMEFTCAVKSDVNKKQDTNKSLLGPDMKPVESGPEFDMDFTECVTLAGRRAEKKHPDNEQTEAQRRSVSPCNQQMDFTECIISSQKISEPDEVPIQNASAESFPDNQMEFTECRPTVSSSKNTDSQATELNGDAVDSEKRLLPADDDACAMDFTECVTSRKVTAGDSTSIVKPLEGTQNKHNQAQSPMVANENTCAMDFTECVTSKKVTCENKGDDIGRESAAQNPLSQLCQSSQKEPVSASRDDGDRTIYLNESSCGMDITCVTVVHDADAETLNGTKRQIEASINDQDGEVTASLGEVLSKDQADVTMDMTCFTATKVSDKSTPREKIDNHNIPDASGEDDIVIPLKNGEVSTMPSKSNNDLSEDEPSDSEDLSFSSPLKRKIPKIRSSIGLYKASRMKTKVPKFDDLSKCEEKDAPHEVSSESHPVSDYHTVQVTSQHNDSAVEVFTEDPVEISSEAVLATPNKDYRKDLMANQNLVQENSSSEIRVEFSEIMKTPSKSIEDDTAITVEDFLSNYVGLCLDDHNKHGIGEMHAPPNPPSSLKELFEAKYWNPKELSLREEFEDSIKDKIAWMESAIMRLKQSISSSNPDSFKTVQFGDKKESEEVVKKVQQFYKRIMNRWAKSQLRTDLAKLYKGLYNDMEGYMKEDLQPIVKQLALPSEKAQLAAKELGDEEKRLDEKLKGFEHVDNLPTSQQAVEYIRHEAELEELNKKHQQLLQQKMTAQEQTQSQKNKRDELLDRILLDSNKAEIQSLRKAKSNMEKRSKWKLTVTEGNLLEFTFLRGTISLKVHLDEKLLSMESNVKIASYSFETRMKDAILLQSDVKLFKLIHQAWQYLVVPEKLILKYPDMDSLKTLLRILSELVQKSEDFIHDKNWINSRIVSEVCFDREDCTFSVEFLAPRIRTDNFAVTFNLNVESSEKPLDEILKNGFCPVFNEYLPGKRIWDQLTADDVESIFFSFSQGDHYLKRFIQAILTRIDYKF